MYTWFQYSLSHLFEKSELCQIENLIEQSQKKTLDYININFRQRSPVILALEDTNIYFL